jgi:hypothetical protein
MWAGTATDHCGVWCFPQPAAHVMVIPPGRMMARGSHAVAPGPHPSAVLSYSLSRLFLGPRAVSIRHTTARTQPEQPASAPASRLRVTLTLWKGGADTTTASRDRSFVPCPLAVGSPPGRGAWTRLVATVTSVRDRYTWIPVVPGGLQGPPWSPGIPHDPQHARFDAPSPSGNQTHTNQGSLYLVKRLDVYSSVAAAIAGIIMFCSVVIRDWDPHTGAGTIDMVGF